MSYFFHDTHLNYRIKRMHYHIKATLRINNLILYLCILFT